jgi:hypothetical protein
MSDQIGLREAGRHEYRDTTTFLKDLLLVVSLGVVVDGEESVAKVWRQRRNKVHREAREAALLLEGIEQRYGIETKFCPVERDDYDALAHYSTPTEGRFVKIQLKQVPPEDVSDTTLNKVIASLAKYPASHDLTVGIHLNQSIRNFRFKDIQVPRLNIAALYVVFAVSQDESRWGLLGDLLTGHEYTEFTYPSHAQ